MGRVTVPVSVPARQCPAGLLRQPGMPRATSQPGLVKDSPSCAFWGEEAGFAPVTPALRAALPLLHREQREIKHCVVERGFLFFNRTLSIM